MNKRVIGLGGIFFKAQDPAKMYEWYQKHLGIESNPYVGASFPARHGQSTTRGSLSG